MPRFPRVLALLSLALIPACSTFDMQWMNTRPMSANPSAQLNGKWEGTWQSDATMYEGDLRGLIVVVRDSTVTIGSKTTQQYNAQFNMKLFGFPFEDDIHVTLNTEPAEDGKIKFTGEKDLGNWMGGIYKFDGYINGKEFFCDYTSTRDSGTFTMRRRVDD